MVSPFCAWIERMNDPPAPLGPLPAQTEPRSIAVQKIALPPPEQMKV
jgi:hypothetical protein